VEATQEPSRAPGPAAAPDQPDAASVEELRGTLTRPLREIPSRYFYDALGSALFDAITRLPEYYPTLAEQRILAQRAPEVARKVRPARIAELGSGEGTKIRHLLAAVDTSRVGLSLVDVSEAAIGSSVERLRGEYPDLRVEGHVADFTGDLAVLGPGGRRLLLLLGGTLGNFRPDAVAPFLARVSAHMAPGDGFLVGVDTVKDPAVLHAAYNDPVGVTAAFNRNILRVLNDRFDADFDLAAFDHLAFWDAEHAWIEMRLVPRTAQRVTLRALDLSLALDAGEPIRTEISCKYTLASFSSAAERGGLDLDAWYTDAAGSFALALLRRSRG
jgi:L-histidine N-alpha-methyltransferase